MIEVVLAMQKVEGSSPLSRFDRNPATAGFLLFGGDPPVVSVHAARGSRGKARQSPLDNRRQRPGAVAHQGEERRQ